MATRGSIVLFLLLAACGGSTTIGGPEATDATTTGGGGSGSGSNVAATVVSVTCPTTTVPVVTAPPAADAMGYTPATVSVSVGGIVQFMMPAVHDVAPNPMTSTDSGLAVDYGENKCLQFTKAGTFGFFCVTHGFSGTVTVQ